MNIFSAIPDQPKGGPFHRLATNTFLRLLIMSACFWLVTPASGATFRYWIGAANGSWSNPNHWDPVGVPQTGESLGFFNGNKSLINDIPNLAVKELIFGEGDWVLSGNPLSIGLADGGGALPKGGIKAGGTQNDQTTSVTINCALIINADDCELQCEAFYGSDGHLRINADINLNGFDLNLYASLRSTSGPDGTGHIEMNGSISGNGNVTARASGYPDGTIEFLGTANNTFTGTLFIEPNVPASADGVFFNKQAGAVADYRIIMEEAARVNWRNSNQVGDNATVVVKDGSRLNLNGYNETIGTLVLTNISADADPSLVDTGVGLGDVAGILTVNDGIVSWVNSVSVLPVIKGVLNLPAGNHNFFVSGTGYEGLDMQATITGAGGFTKYGNAALLLKGTNTFGGTVYAGGGIIDVYNPSGFGSPAGGVALNGGSVTLRNLSVLDEPLFVRGQQQINPETAGSLLTSFGVSAWTGAIELDTNLVVSFGDMTLSGYISGPGGLALHSGGTVQIGGPFNNTYTGTTLVRSPLVEFNKPYGVNAFAGPLIVGGPTGGPYEARWLNYYQSAGTSLTLHANGLVNLNNTTERFGAITFNGGQIDSGPFGICVLGNPVNSNPSYLTVNAANTPAIINGYFQPAGGAAWVTVSNGVADPDLLINAPVIGNAPQLIKQGAGTMRLTAAGNYTGVTIVNEGILDVGHNTALGSASFGTIVNEAATLRLSSFGTVPEGFALFGTGVGGTNGVLHVTGNPTVTGASFLNGPSTINVAPGASLAIDSVISGAGPLTKTGPGNLFLGGVSGGVGNNTYTGSTIVSAGTLYLSKNQNVLCVPGPLVVGPATPAAPATARFSRTGTMPAGGTATVNANGLIDLNGNNQTLAALNLNDGGDVQTGAGQLNFPAGGVVTVGTLNAPQVGLLASSSISGKIGLPVLDYLTFNVSGYGPAPLVSDAELVIPAVISGGGNLIKNGAGRMLLSGANTFNDAPPNAAGDLYIYGGIVVAASPGALGGTAGWTLVYNGARLSLVGNISINNETLYLNSTNSAALDNPGGDNLWTGPITLARDSGIGVNQDWSLNVQGVVSGAGSLTKIGGGKLTLGGSANNTHAGNTFAHDGTLELFKSPFLQAVPHDLIIGSGLPAAPATLVRYRSHDGVWNRITVNANGLLDLNGFDEYSGDLTLNGGGDVQTGTGTFYLANNASLTVNPGTANNPATISGRLGLYPGQHQFIVDSGVTTPGQFDLNITATVFQTSTTAGFNKNGAGRMRLAGTNTYTGLSYLSSGLLQVDGVQPQSTVEMDHETSLRGSGTVGHILFNGGNLLVAPGNSAGSLTCSNFDASGGDGKLEMELNGHPTGYDQIVARGLVDLRGLALQASLNFVSSTGQQFTLINNDGSDAVTGTFTGLPQNKKLYIGGELFQISYTGGTGNDVVLTRLVTPPPPVLTIERASPDSVRLLWPTNDPAFSLQSNTNLTTPNWVSATPLPTLLNTNHVVTNTISGGGRFYRLSSP